MRCEYCKHWQGVKGAEWGDCYRVVAHLQPALLKCTDTNEYGTVLKKFKVPFDPHEIKYWLYNANFAEYYPEALRNVDKLHGIKVQYETREDVMYDFQKGERITNAIFAYVQTRKDFNCEGEFYGSKERL